MNKIIFVVTGLLLTSFLTQYGDAQNVTIDESTPNSQDSVISDEEKSLCSDIMPGHDREIEDFGTVTFEDGTTETCRYLIEQQAIGGIFPNTGEGAGEPDKELTERAIEIRAALGLNASGFPALTYDELIQDHRQAIGNMSSPQGEDQATETELAELTKGQELMPLSSLDQFNDTELSGDRENANEDVTIDDESVRECMVIMDENAEGNPDDYRADYKVANDFGGSILDGHFNNIDTGIDCLDLLTGKLTPSEARNMLGNASFRVLSGEKENTSESTPNGEDSEISDEEKRLCEDIMPDAKIDDDGTVTMTFDDGTTTTETCDYWIEQQAIGGIFPVDKELTERAIEFRAARD